MHSTHVSHFWELRHFWDHISEIYLACDAPQKEKINSTIYFAVILTNKNSKGNCFIRLDWVALLCIDNHYQYEY